MAISKFVLALGLGLAGTMAVQAADLQVAADEPAIAAATSGVAGYVGVNGGWESPDWTYVGVLAGLEFTASEGFLVGVEGSFGADWNDTEQGTTGYVAARAALELDSAEIFALAGAGLVNSEWTTAIGAGAEFEIAENISIRTQGVYFGETDSEEAFTQITVGAVFHF